MEIIKLKKGVTYDIRRAGIHEYLPLIFQSVELYPLIDSAVYCFRVSGDSHMVYMTHEKLARYTIDEL